MQNKCKVCGVDTFCIDPMSYEPQCNNCYAWLLSIQYNIKMLWIKYANYTHGNAIYE